MQEPRRYYFQRNLLPSYNFWLCDASARYGWQGKYMEVLADTACRFINTNNDSILLKTNTRPGDTWTGFKDSLLVCEFRHKSTFNDIVNGVPDSVKEIGIVCKELKPIPPDYIRFMFKEHTISLSKNHGMIKAFNFFNYPYYGGASMVSSLLINLELCDEAKAAKPMRNLTWKDLFSYDTGDEFHYLAYSRNDLVFDSVKSIHIVLAKQVYHDSLVYLVKRRDAYKRSLDGNDSTWVVTDTVNIKHIRNANLDTEPGEIPSQGHMINLYSIDKNVIFKRDVLYEPFVKLGDSCAKYVMDMEKSIYYYVNGAGGPYYDESHTSMSGAKYAKGVKLTYYKKISGIIGNPWPERVGLNTFENSSMQADVYPNPAVDKVRFSTKQTGNMQLSLFGTDNRLVLSNTVKNEEEINIALLAPGLYFYRLQSGDKTAVGKLVVY